MREAKLKIRTAPAAKSFISPIFSLNLGSTKSHKFSIEVLNTSAAKTKAMDKIIMFHSIKEILKSNPDIITRMAINR